MSEEAKKKIVVNEDTCIGCGTCEGVASDYFKIEDGISKVIKDYDPTDKDLIDEAVESCPVGAISIE